MIIKQLFDIENSTYTYLLLDTPTHQALIIDPVDTHYREYLRELSGYTLGLILDTHLHADHVTAAHLLQQETDADYGLAVPLEGVDTILSDQQIITVGDITITVLSTPGHTPDSVCFLVGNYLFTGDTLLIGKCGRTDFQDGSAAQLYDSITQKLFALPDSTLVYPGHDYQQRKVSTIGQEKNTNERIAHCSKAEFISIMDNLHLPPPAMMDLAVPANRKCGRRSDRNEKLII